MAFNRFTIFLVLRLLLLTITITGLTIAFVNEGYHAVTLLFFIASIILLNSLYRYVNRTNAELLRFLNAIRYEDFGQRFQLKKTGAGFEELTKAFDDILENFKNSRHQQEEQLRHLKSMTEHIPVPLLSLYPDGHIQLHNNAARRLFGNITVNKLEDLHVFGQDFLKKIKTLEPGNRNLVNFSYDGIERQLTVVVSQIITGNISEKLISMQDIRSELDDMQLQAWQGLVRVLTHEIMNSINPVTSLAKTAGQLVDTAREKVKNNEQALEELDDVRQAVETVARRSDGLMQFVQNYRSLTLLPAPQKQKLVLKNLFKRIEELFASSWDEKSIKLSIKTEPESLQLFADPDLIEQILINLLRNAEQALQNTETPLVNLSARLNHIGYILIEISDNGPGIPEEIINEIFVPFFTTKHQGSGVGLALTRQIMIAHGGTVTVNNLINGGAKFTLIF